MVLQIKASLKASNLFTKAENNNTSKDVPVPGLGLPYSVLPVIFTNWTGWCRSQRLPTFPVVGGLVCIFLKQRVSPSERKHYNDALELYRSATSPSYIKIRWDTDKVVELFNSIEDAEQYRTFVDNSIWPLTVWDSILELLQDQSEAE